MGPRYEVDPSMGAVTRSPAPMASTTTARTTLRSTDPSDWSAAAAYLTDAEPTDMANVDIASPSVDRLFLVRAENTCPEGTGSIGEPGGIAQVARRCP